MSFDDDRPSPHDGTPAQAAPSPDQESSAPLLRTLGKAEAAGERTRGERTAYCLREPVTTGPGFARGLSCASYGP